MGNDVIPVKKQRIEWIDVLKCIAMYLVVISHSDPRKGSNNAYSYYLYSFHMPLFFVISGYLNNKNPKNEPLGRAVMRRCVAYGIPYVVFSVVAFGLKFVAASVVNSKLELGDCC
jgi:fucose 4-O-acetylase-like acetyltransferase